MNQVWMTSCTESEGWDLRKSSWVPALEEGWLSELGDARRLCALRAPRVGWVESWRCKSSQHRKIVCLLSLSFHVEKPLNSKRWITVSYLNQFRVFGFLYMFMNIMSISYIGIMGMLLSVCYISDHFIFLLGHIVSFCLGTFLGSAHEHFGHSVFLRKVRISGWIKWYHYFLWLWWWGGTSEGVTVSKLD